MFSTDAQPGASTERSAAKPLSTLGAIGVAGTTAAIVFAAGVYFVERGWTGTPAPPRTDAAAVAVNAAGTTARSATLAAPTQGAPGPASAPAASATAPERTATPRSSDLAEASPPAAKAPAAPEKTAAAPRKGYGALEVTSARKATVYVTGVAVGPSNQRVEARCGRAFVRLGEPTTNGTRWLGEGRTVAVRCDALTEVDF
jgi:hypothetical protein